MFQQDIMFCRTYFECLQGTLTDWEDPAVVDPGCSTGLSGKPCDEDVFIVEEGCAQAGQVQAPKESMLKG